jgi:FkbM family methyltransferase
MFALREYLKSILPHIIWQTFGFIKRMPAYWRLDRSEGLRVKNRIIGLPLFITPNIFVKIPESVTAYCAWRNHAIGCVHSSRETLEFLELSNGRSVLIDIGAQTGFMSALFACSRSYPISILSVEPDPQVQAILKRSRLLNMRDGVDWKIVEAAVANEDGKLALPVTNSLYEVEGSTKLFDERIIVPSYKLSSLIDANQIKPDIIKIDVESFEYEILTSSLEVLETFKPALQLEIHWAMLRERGLDSSDFLIPLADLGYYSHQTKYRGLSQWRKVSKYEKVSRISLKTK